MATFKTFTVSKMQRSKYYKDRNAGKGLPHTDKHVIDEVSKISKIKKHDVEMIYRLIFKVLKDKAIAGRNVKIDGFGEFRIHKIKEKKARTGFGYKRGTKKDNGGDIFRPGTEIIIPEKVKLNFKVDKDLFHAVWAAGIKRGDCPGAARCLASDRTVFLPNDVNIFV